MSESDSVVKNIEMHRRAAARARARNSDGAPDAAAPAPDDAAIDEVAHGSDK